ncbi:hypothetical protein ACR30L_07825 [Psychromonas sp. PT13]|uniref:hypothetical protein n=1 Tax=Psychromonas sp. PT13 TaxID=3439547 RepID=UPI003EBAE5A2
MNRHGQFLFSWEENILIIHAKGPFNEEGVLAETNKVKKFILSKNVTKWAKLGIWDDESIGSPEAIAIVENYHQWCIENGCVKTAYVVCNSIQQSISEKVYSSAAQIFKSEDDAKKWLLSNL